jgi:hypothetical protein
MPNLSTTLTLQEVLNALAPAWRLANKTDESEKFLMPDYRRALVEVWEDIVVAAASKDRSPEAWSNLNVAMTKNGPKEGELG